MSVLRYVFHMETNSGTFSYLTCDEMDGLGLPVSPALMELEEKFGPHVVWKLTQTHGGTEIFLRGMHRDAGPLFELLGCEVVEYLYDTYRSGVFKVPMGPFAPSAMKLAHVRFHKRQGLSSRRIALKIGCTARTVQRCNAKLKAAGFT